MQTQLPKLQISLNLSTHIGLLRAIMGMLFRPMEQVRCSYE